MVEVTSNGMVGEVTLLVVVVTCNGMVEVGT